MIAVDIKVVNMIRKIKSYLKEDKLSMEQFPLESIYSLIENTLGASVWDCLGSMKNEAFQKIPEIYREWFEELMKKGDKEGCIRMLDLFENSYKCLYTALADSEKDFREAPFRQMIRDLGSAYAMVQARMHLERQGNDKEWEGEIVHGRGVVYTCLFDKKEKVYQPEEISAELDYICFTDKEELFGSKDGVWKFQKMEMEEEDDKSLNANYCRIFAHKILKEYDYSIWIEPNIKIVGDVRQFIKAYGSGYSFLGFSQCSSDCVYEGIDYAGMCDDDFNISIRKRMKRYEREGYPKHNGLIDSSVIVRSHREEKLFQVIEDWWKEVKELPGLRDNYFNYAAWKNDYRFAVCNLFVYYNPYFKNVDVDLDITGEEY